MRALGHRHSEARRASKESCVFFVCALSVCILGGFQHFSVAMTAGIPEPNRHPIKDLTSCSGPNINESDVRLELYLKLGVHEK